VELKTDSPVWLNKSHQNFTRWQRARELSIDRGKFAKSVLSQKVKVEKLSVLDLGSGEGGTSQVLSENNFVVSFDLNLLRLQRENENDFSIPKISGDALQLPFANQAFDLIIIQDVIEHLLDTNNFYSEVKRVIKKNGIIYLSTPNKYSFINFFSDPHFGLPVISILNRESIKKYFLKYFRKSDYNRNDIAQLFSLNELLNIFKKDFEMTLFTEFALKELLNGNNGIVWSDFHLKMIRFIKVLKFDQLINRLSNNNFGILNKYVTPTFYIVLTRK
jgi:SAM-dependent methyltransferase